MTPALAPEPRLVDGTLVLRAWSEDDAPVLAEAARDAYVALIERMPVPFDAAAGRAWIEGKRAFREQGRGWELAIVEDGAVVGGTGIGFRHPPGTAEPGIWVVERARCRGIAERAVRLLCAWALSAGTGIERVQATVHLWNAASQRVLEKVGFVREGLLRGYTSDGGVREDVYVYGLLPGDLRP